MAIHSSKNLYPGVNPHLNSFLQQPKGAWQSFHKDYNTLLRLELDKLLPEKYYASTETSLQIGAYDGDAVLRSPSLTVPDVSVYRTDGLTNSSYGILQPDKATQLIPILETVDDAKDLTGVVIYRVEDDRLPGKPVTRIELLSPAYKMPGAHFPVYYAKRQETLFAGLRLVEIDFLHERDPILRHIPSYRAKQDKALPYHIIISDPRPTWEEGITEVHSFGVVDAIPSLLIPLDEMDTVKVDFGEVYHRTMESARLFRQLADYAQDPVNFETYTEADRELIRERIKEAGQANG